MEIEFSVFINRMTFIIEQPTDVVGMTVRQEKRINILRINPGRTKIFFKQPS